MATKYFVLKDELGNPIELIQEKVFADTKSYFEFVKQCEENKKEQEQRIADYEQLKKRVALIELELKYNRGEITETEYNELCNGI